MQKFRSGWPERDLAVFIIPRILWSGVSLELSANKSLEDIRVNTTELIAEEPSAQQSHALFDIVHGT